MRRILTRNDGILIALIIAAALLSVVPVVVALGRRAPGAQAEVLLAGRRIAVLSLSKATTLRVSTKAGIETIQVERGAVRVAKAPCPRKICSHTGWIKRAGEELVCVPGEMIVRVVGGEPARVDAVSR